MKHRILSQPTIIVDDFFESPTVWREYALKQTFNFDSKIDTYAGERTATLDKLNINLFHKVAGKLIKHIPHKSSFSKLQMSFTLTDKTYGTGWIHDDEDFYNVAGIIYLTPNPPPNTGTAFYHKTAHEPLPHFNDQFFNELKAAPEDRHIYEKYKEEQRSVFKKTLTVENIYNRCVLFNPTNWHSVERYFGNTKEDSRLVLTIFGHAV